MRTHVLGAFALAVLVTAGAGCASSSNVEVDVETTPGMPGIEVDVETDGDAAAGTQLEGTPAENDTPDADINLDADADVSVGAVKTFTVTGDNFAYDVNEIKVKKGDKVRIIFKNAEGFHDWNLDEFGAKTAKLQAATEETIEFTADKAGTFEYYCSVGSHRAMGMKGNLIVE